MRRIQSKRWFLRLWIEDPSLGRRAGSGDWNERVPQQFVSAPVESPLGVGRPTGRPARFGPSFKAVSSSGKSRASSERSLRLLCSWTPWTRIPRHCNKRDCISWTLCFLLFLLSSESFYLVFISMTCLLFPVGHVLYDFISMTCFQASRGCQYLGKEKK